jgi:hypothetical protein
VDPTGEFAIAIPWALAEAATLAEAAGWAGLGAGFGWALWDAWNNSQDNVCYIHGDNPEGKTGKKSTWNKHSKKRAGNIYGNSKNNKRGKKNKKYKKPPNPNKR